MNRFKSRTRWLKQTVYLLQRTYGVPAAIYKPAIGANDYTTGAKIITRTRFDVPKMVILNAGIKREMKIDVRGDFQVGDREVLVEAVGYVFDDNDYVVVESKRYDIVFCQQLDYKRAYYMHVRQSQDALPYQIVTKHIKQILEATEVVTWT